MKKHIYKISLTGILSALSLVLVLLIHFPIFPAVPFLEYDPADIPIFIISAFFGMGYGLSMTAVVSIVQGITVSASSGIIGIIMHFLATGAFVVAQCLVLKLLSKKGHKNFSHLISILAGALTMTLVMALLNILITPLYMNVSYKVLFSIFGYIVAFNLIKSLLNGFAAFLIKRALSKVITINQ